MECRSSGAAQAACMAAASSHSSATANTTTPVEIYSYHIRCNKINLASRYCLLVQVSCVTDRCVLKAVILNMATATSPETVSVGRLYAAQAEVVSLHVLQALVLYSARIKSISTFLC
jgi:hypothetical protein